MTKPAIIVKSASNLSAGEVLKINPLLKPVEVNVDDNWSMDGAVIPFAFTPTNNDLKVLSLYL